MKRYHVFIPTALLLVLALWPFAVYPMTRISAFWAFYLTTPITVIAFVALVAGIAVYRRNSN
jgi:hypothetical protein